MWTVLVHPGQEVFQTQGGNQVARGQGVAEYEVGRPLGTWMHGGLEMRRLTASGQRQRRRVSELMHGLVQPLADLLKPRFPRWSLQGHEMSVNDQESCSSIPRSSSFSLWHSSSTWALSSNSCSSNIFSSRARAYLASTSDRLDATARSFLSRSSLPISSSRSWTFIF